jgi:2'-5' RNA ligase
MLTFHQFLQEKYGTGGTYAAMKFDSRSEGRIARYMLDNKIPNPLDPHKLHVTLLYSRKYMEGFKARGTLESPMAVTVAGFDVWDTQDKQRALVARLDAPELVSRHKELMDKYKGTYDFPDYKPHFTLSYNVGTEFDSSALLPFNDTLKLATEYGEDLNTDWNKTADKDAD